MPRIEFSWRITFGSILTMAGGGFALGTFLIAVGDFKRGVQDDIRQLSEEMARYEKAVDERFRAEHSTTDRLQNEINNERRRLDGMMEFRHGGDVIGAPGGTG